MGDCRRRRGRLPAIITPFLCCEVSALILTGLLPSGIKICEMTEKIVSGNLVMLLM